MKKYYDNIWDKEEKESIIWDVIGAVGLGVICYLIIAIFYCIIP